MKPGDRNDMDSASGEVLLERAFEAARQDAPVPDADLMRRIMADAEEVQAGFAPAAPVRAAARRVRLGALLMEAVGGFRGLGGLAAASAFGLWLGLSPPQGLSEYARALYGETGLGAASALEADYAYLASLGEL